MSENHGLKKKSIRKFTTITKFFPKGMEDKHTCKQLENNNNKYVHCRHGIVIEKYIVVIIT